MNCVLGIGMLVFVIVVLGALALFLMQPCENCNNVNVVCLNNVVVVQLGAECLALTEDIIEANNIARSLGKSNAGWCKLPVNVSQYEIVRKYVCNVYPPSSCKTFCYSMGQCYIHGFYLY